MLEINKIMNFIDRIVYRLSTKHDNSILSENVYTSLEGILRDECKVMLNDFFNSGSDAGNIEAKEQEDLERDFEFWVKTTNSLLPDEVVDEKTLQEYLRILKK